jgi:hypothetical protein
MRKSISVVALAVVAVAAVWTWTISNSGANARYKLSGAAGINTLDLTMKAKDLPVQQFDAH